MKKIQIQTVEMKANAEVILLNTSFVARTVRATEILIHIKRCLEGASIKYLLDDEGERMVDENGNFMRETKVGETDCYVQAEEVSDLYNIVIPFMEDLCNALLGEEA